MQKKPGKDFQIWWRKDFSFSFPLSATGKMRNRNTQAALTKHASVFNAQYMKTESKQKILAFEEWRKVGCKNLQRMISPRSKLHFITSEKMRLRYYLG